MNAILKVLILLVVICGQIGCATTTTNLVSSETRESQSTTLQEPAIEKRRVAKKEEPIQIGRWIPLNEVNPPALPAAKVASMATPSKEKPKAAAAPTVEKHRGAIKEINHFGRSPLLNKDQVKKRLGGVLPLLPIEVKVLKKQAHLTNDEIEDCNAQVLGKKGTRPMSLIYTGTKVDWMSGRGGKITREFVYTGAPALALSCASGKVQQPLIVGGMGYEGGVGCGNWMSHSVASVPPSPPIQPRTSPSTISIYKEVNERQAIIELQAGVWGGKAFGSVYDTGWYGGQTWVYVPIEKYVGSDDQLSVGVGLYGAGEQGHSHVSTYGHDGHRIIGMLGVKGNHLDQDLNPSSWSLNVGIGTDWMRGSTEGNSYWMKQKKLIGRVYTDYLTQRGDWVYGVYGEGLVDFGGHKSSSWSGFRGEDRSMGLAGLMAEWRFSEHWSFRADIAGLTNVSNGKWRFFGQPSAKLCFRDSWHGGDGFAIACAGAGATMGLGTVPFLNASVFAGETLYQGVMAQRANGVGKPQIGKGKVSLPLSRVGLQLRTTQ